MVTETHGMSRTKLCVLSACFLIILPSVSCDNELSQLKQNGEISLEKLIKRENCEIVDWERFLDPTSLIDGREKWHIALNVSICRWRSYRPKWINSEKCLSSSENHDNIVPLCLRSLPDDALVDFFSTMAHLDRIDRSLRQIQRQQEMISLSTNSQNMAQEISRIQKRIRESQLEHDSQLEDLRSLMEIFGSDMNKLISEAEPALLLVERIENLHRSVLDAYNSVSHSSDVFKVLIYVICILFIGFIHRWIACLALSILLRPTPKLRRDHACRILNDGLFFLEIGESIRAGLFLSIPDFFDRTWFGIVVIVPIVVAVFSTYIAFSGVKSQPEPQPEQGIPEAFAPIPPVKLRVSPRIYRRGEYTKTQQRLTEERTRKLHRRYSTLQMVEQHQ